jgi:MOSC domain-containing protein YiiM
MKLVSVNVSMQKTIDHLGRKVRTGIYKVPVACRVMVRKLNVDGDGHADLRYTVGFTKPSMSTTSKTYVTGNKNLIGMISVAKPTAGFAKMSRGFRLLT